MHVAVVGVHMAGVLHTMLTASIRHHHHQNPLLLPLDHHVGAVEAVEDVGGTPCMRSARGLHTSPCCSRIPPLAPLVPILLSPRRKTEEPT